MATYSDFEQQQLDIESGAELDRAAARKNRFHAGQEVKVFYTYSRSNEATWPWVKGKIVHGRDGGWLVQLADGTIDFFDTAHIRPTQWGASLPANSPLSKEGHK